MGRETELSVPERIPKHIYDAMRRYRESLKLSNASLTRARPLTPKNYLAGNAYLRWKEAIFKANGDRYEATFVARRSHGFGDDRPLVVLKRDDHARRVFDGEHDLMLVGDIKAMDAKQRPVPSMVGLRVTSEAGRDITCTWTDNLLSDFSFEFREVPNDRKIGSLCVSSVEDGACGDEMIKRRPQVMDGVASDQRQFARQCFSASDNEAVALHHWIELRNGEVGIAAEISRGCRVEISDVGFCPVKL